MKNYQNNDSENLQEQQLCGRYEVPKNTKLKSDLRSENSVVFGTSY